jgi:hypothetical protein
MRLESRQAGSSVLFHAAATLTLAVLTVSCSGPTPAPASTQPAPSAGAVTAPCDPANPPPTPFTNNNGDVPPPNVYAGPMFTLSHDYAAAAGNGRTDRPWTQTLKGQIISRASAPAYVDALKSYVADDVRTLVLDYRNWDAAGRGWYNEPWLGCEREPIHGMYLGSAFPKGTFTGQSVDMWTWVLTYYDRVAATSLSRVWGATAMTPNLTERRAQFPEGSVIVKIALTTATAAEWPVMTGTPTWPLYHAPMDMNGNPTGPVQLSPASLLQIDIVVKDTIASPKTGWVFSTLVYDHQAPGDAWAKMVPLGAMWGNDPEVTEVTGALKETFINTAAPAYSKETLGWGGRLSGPNDGAVVAPAIIDRKEVTSQAASSCLGCHIAAEWPRQSFLLPSPSPTGHPGEPTMNGNAMVLFTPVSKDWMRWFQDPSGATPMDAGSVALDFDMVYSFKSLPQWAAATKQPESALLPTLGKGRSHPSRRYGAR